MSKEIWKDVPGYNGIYQASNYGNARMRKNNTFKLLKPFMNGDGYLQLTLPISIEGQPKYPHLGRFIASAFCYNENPMKNIVVDHLDNNHLNNRADNLEWITQAENVRRAGRIGRVPKKTECRCIETDKKFKSIAEASRYYGIRYYSVYGSCETGKAIKGLHFERIEEYNE